MREVALANTTLVAIVDDEDYERVSQLKWHLKPGRHTFYAIASTGKTKRKNNKPLRMHRFVLPSTTAKVIDHINRNGLDNRKSNLREATMAQNTVNSGPNRLNTSGFKGAYYDKRDKYWLAAIKHNNKFIRIGSYDSAEEAARAYDAEAKRLLGEFAWLNFPLEHRDKTWCIGDSLK